PPGEKKKNYWQRPNNYVRILTLLFIIGYTGIQGWQTYLMRANNIVSQRAFVFATGWGNALIVSTPNEHALRIPFLLSNTGSTATKNLRFYFRCIQQVTEATDPFHLLFERE